MTSQPPTSDRDYLEDMLRRIEQHGVVAEYHSNLISVADRLLGLRTAATDPRERERLDELLDTQMRVIDGNEPHVPRSIDEHLDDVARDQMATYPQDCEELHRRMLDIFEAAVDRLASARPAGGDSR
jgi:hypothetical protein